MLSIKNSVEYAVLRVFVAFVRVLPLNGAYRLMEGLTLGAHERLGWRKQSTQARIARVFPEESGEKQTWIRREAVKNLGRNLTELILKPEKLQLTFEGMEETFAAFRKAREKGKGVLLVIVHSGNWDLAGIRTVQRGFPMCFVARRQKNQLTYEMLVKVREQSGGTEVDRDDPKLIRKLLSFLQENGIVAVLIDIRSRKAGETFSYLGHQAWLANGLGLLAGKSQAEVIPVYLGRRGRGTHLWKPLAPRRLEAGNQKPEKKALLQSCLDDLGAEVMKHPESYFWFNKRWVLEPFDSE